MDNDRELIKKFSENFEKISAKSKWIYARYFCLGVCYGLGATIGVAIVIALVGVALRSLGGLPVIGEWLNGLSQNLQNTNFNL